MKQFVKEILFDSAILSVLIILPLAFLGPGWRSQDSSRGHHGFREQHRPLPEETTGEGREGVKRDITILRAFDVQREADRPQPGNEGD